MTRIKKTRNSKERMAQRRVCGEGGQGTKRDPRRREALCELLQGEATEARL